MFGIQNVNEVISKEFMGFIYKPTLKKNLLEGYVLYKVYKLNKLRGVWLIFFFNKDA